MEPIHVPTGLLGIARRFNAWCRFTQHRVPKGRLGGHGAGEGDGSGGRISRLLGRVPNGMEPDVKTPS